MYGLIDDIQDQRKEIESLRRALIECRKQCQIIYALVPNSSSGQAAKRCIDAACVALGDAQRTGAAV